MNSVRTLLLVRHPEAQKNVQDRHGGRGTGLTSEGMAQCQAIAKYVLANYPTLNRGRLVGHDVSHVQETVALLAAALNMAPIWDERLRGIDLGVLAGLSRSEAAAQFPGPAERLERWRHGTISLDRLNIPRAEPVESFRHRVEALLKEWLRGTDASPIVAVCTRSVLIMAVNLLEMGIHFNYTDYRPLEFVSGSITTVVIEHGTARLVTVNQPVG